MNKFLRALGLATGLALSAAAGAAHAVTVAANSIGSTFSIGYAQNYIDPNNPGGVSLSATSDWTLTGYSATSTTATWAFNVLVSNTTLASAVGTNRLSSWGFDTTPNSTAANASPASGWFYASGNVPSQGSYDICLKSGGGPQNCGGNGSGGIAEGGSQLFSIVFNTALANPLTFNNFYVRYQGVGAGSNGSTAFTGTEIPAAVPLPPAGLALLAGLGALVALRRRKHAVA